MSLTEQLEADVRNLYEIVFRLLRVGVVDSTNPAKATVRVRFADQASVITWNCQVLYPKTNQDKAYWMPDIGDHVMVLSLPYGPSQGFVVGAIYSSADKTPVSSQDKRHVLFKDGTYLEYDRKTHNLSGHIKGKVDGLTVDENAKIDVGGDVAETVGGSVNAEIGKDLAAQVGQNADVTAGNLSGHIKGKVDGLTVDENAKIDVGGDVTETVGGSVNAEIGKDLAAQVGQNADVTAGSQITLNAPLIKMLGNLTSAGAGGGAATETKEANTEHTGSYTLNGDLEVSGSIHATGDIIADGANVNHHSH
jgi:phage baseplate assembly protein V